MECFAISISVVPAGLNLFITKTFIMNADMILKSDLIDLIFERRNKDYGAYQLRRLYNKHLLIAICGPVLLLIFSWWIVDRSGYNLMQPIAATPVVETPVSIIQLPPTPRVPPQPVARSIRKPVSANTEFYTPVISDDVITDVPEIGNFDDVIIGKKTTDPVGEPGPPIETVVESIPAEPVEAEPSIYDTAELMPEFPGGLSALSRFLSKHLRVPDEIDEPGTRVKILVYFVVDHNGSLASVQFKDSVPAVYQKEIRRVFMKMPKWNPGSQHGKLVSVYHHLPIIFEIPEL
jgi:periplasmic protein TonB